jgi:hypothetical protein
MSISAQREANATATPTSEWRSERKRHACGRSMTQTIQTMRMEGLHELVF